MSMIDNLSPFLLSVVACPISKEPLQVRGEDLLAPCGFVYRQGDLRVGLEFSEAWARGQAAFEKSIAKRLGSARGDPEFYRAVDAETEGVYKQIEMSGRVLDVGGGFGTLAQQAQLAPHTYICLDAYPYRWSIAQKFPGFSSHYAACEKLTRVPAFAEFLPIRTGSMDVVHMRSCLDHFSNPLLALREAYRTLTAEGKLVVGLALEGAYKKGARGTKDALKQFVKRNPAAHLLYETFFDHHMFHPTMPKVQALVDRAGFIMGKMVWQECYENVIYFEATKQG